MDRRWEELTHRERKIVTGLARSTRSNGPMMIKWLNKVNSEGQNVWENIEALAAVFDKSWMR